MPPTLPFQLADAALGDGMSLVVVDPDGVQYEVNTAQAAASYLKTAWASTLELLTGSDLVAYSPEVVIRSDEGRALAITDDLREENEIIEELLDDMDRTATGPSAVPGELYLYAVISDTAAGRIAMIKKKNPTKRARGGKALFNAGGNELRRLDDDPWELHPVFDLVVSEGGGFALNTYFFEQLFADAARLTAKIGPWVDDIGAHVPMSDESKDVLKSRCDDSPRLRRRLRAITHRGHIPRVTIAKVRAHARRMDLPVGSFVKQGKLVVTEDNVADVLHLLNEDFSRGGLTDDPFLIEAKEPLR